jgi:hypothetical protein
MTQFDICMFVHMYTHGYPRWLAMLGPSDLGDHEGVGPSFARVRPVGRLRRPRGPGPWVAGRGAAPTEFTPVVWNQPSDPVIMIS